MLLSEIATFLTVASQFDNRHIDDNMCAAWGQVIDLYLPTCTYEEALTAVHAHFAERADWLMPNMFIEQVRRQRAAKANLSKLFNQPVTPKSDLGYQVVVRTLAEIRAAGGGDPRNGKVIGKERCTEIAERVIEEMGVKTGQERSRHCGRQGCQCTHTEGCEGGWIELADGSAVAACQWCRPTAAHILAQATSTLDAGSVLRDPLRNQA